MPVTLLVEGCYCEDLDVTVLALRRCHTAVDQMLLRSDAVQGTGMFRMLLFQFD
jgi:hypothetical protein